jgi:hypothetical protein
VLLLLERDLVSWSLAMDERVGHEDLCGSGHWSIIPYVHGRTEMYCSSLPFCPLTCEVMPTRAIYSLRSSSYIETRGLIGDPEVVETLYNI